MELGEFLKDPIAPILRENFVEARLHTDSTKPIRARILELQEQMVGDQGLPTYVVVDAEKAKSTGVVYRGITIDDEEIQDFVLFLKDGLSAARAKPASIEGK